jgi:hypothetical protein
MPPQAADLAPHAHKGERALHDFFQREGELSNRKGEKPKVRCGGTEKSRAKAEKSEMFDASLCSAQTKEKQEQMAREMPVSR